MRDVFSPLKEVEIKNFKSIKHLKIRCKRVNIFIGKPNTGKSNILEAIVGFPSMLYYGYANDKLFIRHKELNNLFYYTNLKEKIEISYLWRSNNDQNYFFTFILFYNYESNRYIFRVEPDIIPDIAFPVSITETFYLSNQVKVSEFIKIIKKFKLYRFNEFSEYNKRREIEFLFPPDGTNLFSIILANKEIRDIVQDIVDSLGLKLILDTRHNELGLGKIVENTIILFPYEIISETLRRLIFYIAAVKSNEGSIIAMEEPEAHAFPYYTKYLAEIIASDRNNQYFITTHNPYFLLSLIEKTPKDEINVFLTYYEDDQTKVKELSEEELQEILEQDIDVFFNLDRFLK